MPRSRPDFGKSISNSDKLGEPDWERCLGTGSPSKTVKESIFVSSSVFMKGKVSCFQFSDDTLKTNVGLEHTAQRPFSPASVLKDFSWPMSQYF